MRLCSPDNSLEGRNLVTIFNPTSFLKELRCLRLPEEDLRITPLSLFLKFHDKLLLLVLNLHLLPLQLDLLDLRLRVGKWWYLIRPWKENFLIINLKGAE